MSHEETKKMLLEAAGRGYMTREEMAATLDSVLHLVDDIQKEETGPDPDYATMLHDTTTALVGTTLVVIALMIETSQEDEDDTP